MTREERVLRILTYVAIRFMLTRLSSGEYTSIQRLSSSILPDLQRGSLGSEFFDLSLELIELWEPSTEPEKGQTDG